MSLTLEEAMNLHERLTPKELELAHLKESEAQLIKERDYWKSRALAAEGKADGERKSRRFIVISVEKLKKVLSTIHDLHILSVLFLVFHKSMPKDNPAENAQQLDEIIQLPDMPSISLTANGDLNVNGNYTDVHDNDEVKF